jgi:prevent-host-death family protein
MTHPVSLSEAKAQLVGLVHAAEGGEVVHISRHGKPVAVLLSEQAYAALQGQHQQQHSMVWEAIAQWRSADQVSHPEDWLLASGVSGEEAVKSWRDRSVGREVWLA